MADWKARARRFARSIRTSDTSPGDNVHLLHIPVEPDQREYIRHGYSPEVDTVTIDLRDITADDRDLVADYYVRATAAARNRVSVSAATPEAVLDALRAKAQATKELDHKYAREREKLLQQAAVVVAERRTRIERNWLQVGQKNDESVSYEIVVPDWPIGVTGTHSSSRQFSVSSLPVAEVIRETGATAWVSELAALNNQRRIAAKSNYERQRSEQQSGYEEGKKILCDWAQTRPDTRAILDDKRGGWVRKLENLWIETKAPAGYDALHPVMRVLDNDEPTPDDLEALKDAQSVCDGNVVSNARLGLVRAGNARPENTRNMVGVAITAPTGHCRVFWRRVESRE